MLTRMGICLLGSEFMSASDISLLREYTLCCSYVYKRKREGRRERKAERRKRRKWRRRRNTF